MGWGKREKDEIVHEETHRSLVEEANFDHDETEVCDKQDTLLRRSAVDGVYCYPSKEQRFLLQRNELKEESRMHMQTGKSKSKLRQHPARRLT